MIKTVSFEIQKAKCQKGKAKENIDIIKKFDNIKKDMNNMNMRMFIHEFLNENDEINYDLIYA